MHLIYHNHLLHNIFTCRIIKFVQVPARFELKTCRLVAVPDTYSTEQGCPTAFHIGTVNLIDKGGGDFRFSPIFCSPWEELEYKEKIFNFFPRNRMARKAGTL